MSDRLRRPAPEREAVFLSQSRPLSADDVGRAIRRMAHEVVEKNTSIDDVIIVGLQTGGVAIARAMADALGEIVGQAVSWATLDVAFYRDDVGTRPLSATSSTTIASDLTDRTILLVDDVLYTGRTIRAALNALSDWGRPRAVQLAVMVDRGHRELPIRPDYVGKNLPTARDEVVVATLEGVSIGRWGS